jgi:hypothetical protein
LSGASHPLGFHIFLLHWLDDKAICGALPVFIRCPAQAIRWDFIYFFSTGWMAKPFAGHSPSSSVVRRKPSVGFRWFYQSVVVIFHMPKKINPKG